jgi:DNA-binding HxlR family transcriptional regulator
MDFEPANVLSDQCPSRAVLNLIADKWSLLVLYSLSCQKIMRYGQLQRHIRGISQKMLTQTLRELERNGFVQRTMIEVMPPQVEYRLTNLGGSLQDVVAGLCGWAEQHLPSVLESQQQFDHRQASNTKKIPESHLHAGF